MRTQEQFRIIETVKIVDRISCSEADSCDLLQINIVHFLRLRRSAAEAETVESILQRLPELTAEHGRLSEILDGIVSRLRRIIDDPSPVRQDHKLVLIHMDHRTIGKNIRTSLLFTPFAHDNTSGTHRLCVHLVRFHYLQPLILKTSFYC